MNVKSQSELDIGARETCLNFNSKLESQNAVQCQCSVSAVQCHPTQYTLHKLMVNNLLTFCKQFLRGYCLSVINDWLDTEMSSSCRVTRLT